MTRIDPSLWRGWIPSESLEGWIPSESVDADRVEGLGCGGEGFVVPSSTRTLTSSFRVCERADFLLNEDWDGVVVFLTSSQSTSRGLGR